MSKLSKRMKNKLFSIISDMEKDKYQYVKNPNSDFVRTRKLSFSTMMKILISMGGNTLHKELYGFYETFVTNPDRDSFDVKTLKKLYRMRWGVETSFRELKYSIGLTNFHSKKPEFILQEILARLIMYNISMIISVNVCVKQKNILPVRPDRKDTRRITYKSAVSFIYRVA